MGDFNVDFSKTTSTTKNLQRITKSFCLKQLIKGFTRVTQQTRTLIDLFFTSRPELYFARAIPVGFPDHSAIFGVRRLHRIKRPQPKIIEARNYKHYDPALFREELEHIPWEIIELEETTEGSWNAFNRWSVWRFRQHLFYSTELNSTSETKPYYSPASLARQ